MPRSLTAADVWFEVGRRVQAVALVMRKHTLAPGLGVCDCGRLPDRELPMFGPRCEIAGQMWDRAHEAMHAVLKQVSSGQPSANRTPWRASGRAAVPSSHTRT